MIFVWVFKSRSRFWNISVSTTFAVIVLMIWITKAPGGNLFYDGPGYVSLTSQIIAEGHLIFAGWGEFPAMHAILAFLSVTSALPPQVVVVGLDAVRPVIVAVLSFLLAENFLSPQKASLATALSVIGDFQISKLSPSDPLTFGLMFYLLFAVLMFRYLAKPTLRYKIALLLVLGGSVLAYPGDPPIIISSMILLALIDRKARMKLLLPVTVVIGLYATWTIYIASYVWPYTSVIATIERLFSPSSGGSTSFGTTGQYYLFQLIGSNLNALPYDLVYLLPFWFIILYVGGFSSWVMLVVRKRIHSRSFNAICVVALAFGVSLFSLPGGAEWVRALLFLGPFFSIALVLVIENKRFWNVLLISLIAILLLPTIVAYYPTVGTTAAHFQYQFSSGNFLQAGQDSLPVFYGYGVITLNYSLLGELAPSVSYVPQTSSQGLAGAMAELAQFQSLGNRALLSLDPTYYAHFSHLFGSNSSKQLSFEIQNRLSMFNIIYSNHYTSIYQNR